MQDGAPAKVTMPEVRDDGGEVGHRLYLLEGNRLWHKRIQTRDRAEAVPPNIAVRPKNQAAHVPKDTGGLICVQF
ncbi:hypothetical protein OKHIF_17590 [Mycobacteroides chelonae]